MVLFARVYVVYRCVGRVAFMVCVCVSYIHLCTIEEAVFARLKQFVVCFTRGP